MVLFFNDTATTEIYTLSLHDALPISPGFDPHWPCLFLERRGIGCSQLRFDHTDRKSTRLNSSHANISYAVFCLKKKRSEEQTSELQSRQYIVCRLMLENKKTN